MSSKGLNVLPVFFFSNFLENSLFLYTIMCEKNFDAHTSHSKSLLFRLCCAFNVCKTVISRK